MIVVFDFETVCADVPASIIADLNDGELKVDNRTKDPEKIREKLQEMYWRTTEGARPVALGMCYIDMECRKICDLKGIQSNAFREIAEWAHEYLTEHPPIQLVGYCSTDFDFPILQRALALLNKPLEQPLRGRYNAHLDLAREIPTFGTAKRRLKGTATSACSLYNIKHAGGDGGDVAAMVKEDNEKGTNKVLDYCLEDVRATAELYMKLSILQSFL